MQITTNDNKVISLNKEQIKAIEDFHEFMESKDLFICLSGSAGTGKTTIAIEMLEKYSGIVVTAPTHKAKKEISVKTGYEAKTIHSLCGLRPDMNLEEFSQNNMQFSQSHQDSIFEYRVVCIDESSMLNKDLVCLIKEKASMYNVKILFMGDIMQLPPVKERISTVFTDPEIKQIKLTKVERQQEGNPLFDIYDSILSDINSQKDLYKKENNVNEKEEGYEFIFNIREFGEKILPYFDSSFNNKIVCWTNNKTRQWNNYIRSIFFGNKSELQTNEVLMAYRSVYDDNEQDYIIYNSCEYKIISISKDEYKGYDGFWALMEDLDTNISTKVFILNQNNKENLKKFIDTEKKLSDAAKSADKHTRGYKWKQYYQFRNSLFIVRDIISPSGKIIIQKDFDYSYAITIHKSQGSTFDNVFIDEVDIDLNNNHYERNRLKYVAFSRPIKKAIVNASQIQN